MYEVVKLYVVSVNIVLDQDSQFKTQFWKKLQDILGSKLEFNIVYHSMMDSQSERNI